ncbi:glucokinase [Prochlorococcus marinus]|uniref:glucokinase n=1 Tax=Prochlorococcus marinus TaxID=1219 RepID=UPI0022B5A348|nr:glucokinase [Prochlorococcus marinus]
MNLLAGDIGGTKTLLGIYKFDGKLKLIIKEKYLSREWQSFNQILKEFLSKLPNTISSPSIGCIGVAGKVNNGNVKITNLDWDINEKILNESIKTKKILLLNDFSCLVHAIPFLENDQFTYIQSVNNKITKNSNKDIFSIIGAGTGLGMARGFNSNSGIEVLASEGGHKEFACRTQSEWELCQWLKKDLNLERLSIERVVSGTGLGNIARWRLMKEDAKSHPLRPTAEKIPKQTDLNHDFPEIVSNFAHKGDPIMKEVLEIWLSAYGSAVGDLALHELSSSGIWISGGTAAKHLTGFQSEIFLKALKNKGRFTNFLEKIPIMALIDPDAGLFGAACKAHLTAKRINLSE